MPHSHRRQNPSLELMPAVLARNLLDDTAEQDIGRVAVRIAASWLKIELPTRVIVEQTIERNRLDQPAIDKIKRIIVRIPGSVIHEVEKCDVLRTREMREVFADRIA